MTGKFTGNRSSLRGAPPLGSARLRSTPSQTKTALAPSRATAPLRYAAPTVARTAPVKAVGTFVPTLTRKAFEKYGFAAATLITDWRDIAGAALAGYTLPERLKWPRLPGDSDAGNESGEGRPGATLILRVDPARALDVEYKARQIIDRINAYFGYRAVAEISLIQAPLPAAKERPSAKAAPMPPDAQKVTPDDPLAAALARLAQNVKAKT